MNLRTEELAAWPHVGPCFDQVLELDPTARDGWLRELAATQPQLAAAVRSLLEEHAALDAAGFMNEPLLTNATGLAGELHGIVAAGDDTDQDADPSGLDAGATLGPYRLIRKIGRGGMSSVWLAASDAPIKREVALKLPLHGSSMQLGRFERERDLLAALTHPNIARLYDAGTATSGQPYLAMEYVPGTALLESCDTQRLTIRERLQLFQQVLEAVQYAHSQLVIHRDLKPSNIVVAQGRVVLLDFGIGKLLTTEHDATDATLTQLAGRALTPRYASPEQIAGQPLGTASDVYSLGVILYELLTGTSPYRPARDTRASLEDAILTEEVLRPSQSLLAEAAATQRRLTPSALARTLRGDLDTIVLKALKKAPRERYASITAFTQDIANLLAGLPVSARPDSRWYRVGHFIARHKIPVFAASAILCAVLCGASLALWQAHAAGIERDRAVSLAVRNQAVTELLGRLITEAAEAPTSITVNELVQRSEKLALTDSAGSHEARAAVLGMLAEHHTTTGNHRHASQILHQILTLLENTRDQGMKSQFSCRLAAVMLQADFAQFDTAVQMISRELPLLHEDPDAAIRCLTQLSFIYGTMYRGEDAVRYARRALDLSRNNPGASTEREMAVLLSGLARSYHLIGRNAEALEYFDQAAKMYSALGRSRSNGSMIVLNNWALLLHDAGAPQRALKVYEQVLDIEKERGPNAEPTPTTVGNQARALVSVGHYQQAREAFELECRLATDPLTEVHCVLGLASLMRRLHSYESAAKYLLRAKQLLGKTVPLDSPPMRICAIIQGWLDLANDKPDLARAQFALALKSTGTMHVEARLARAELELSLHNTAAAAADARIALDISKSLQGGLPFSNRTGLAALMLGRALLQNGDTAHAKQALAMAVEHLSDTVDSKHPDLQTARQLLAGV